MKPPESGDVPTEHVASCGTILAEEAIDLADVNAEDVSKSLAEAREDLGQARNDEERHDAEARIEKFQALLSELSH